MMLTGKSIRARQAKSLGLVDAVTQERHVARRGQSGGRRRAQDRRAPVFP